MILINYVMLYYERNNKLQFNWRGPYMVSERVNELIYEVQDINNGHIQKVHINRMHPFYAGKMTEKELKNEALHDGEFFIEKVYAHTTDGRGTIWLRVKWLGYEDYDPSDDRAWVKLEDSADSPEVQQYCTLNKLLLPK
jgi:hypothetical protein